MTANTLTKEQTAALVSLAHPLPRIARPIYNTDLSQRPGFDTTRETTRNLIALCVTDAAIRCIAEEVTAA